MEQSKLITTSIEGFYIIKMPVFPDDRGFFHEVFRLNLLQEKGIEFNPVQWNHSFNKSKVLRGIHTEEWQKIIYLVKGSIFAAIVDVRADSPTFMKVETIALNSEKDSERYALFLPKGIGNSFCVTSETPADYMYLVDEYWDNSKAKGIAWNDPDIKINWPIKDPVISDRDNNNPTLRQLYPEKFK